MMVMMMFYDDDDDNGKGRDLLKKIVHFQALPELANLPPTQFGQLGPFLLDVKTTFYPYDRKKVPMMIMISIQVGTSSISGHLIFVARSSTHSQWSAGSRLFQTGGRL